jgi:hypothetical protein
MGLSVVATSHAAATITINGNETCNYVYVVNTSTTLYVGVNFTPTGLAATLPGDGTTGNFVLPPASATIMTVPNGVGANPLQVTAIASAAGPTVVTVTPIGIQT